MTYSIAIGYQTNTSNTSNSIAIGYQANPNNTISIGGYSQQLNYNHPYYQTILAATPRHINAETESCAMYLCSDNGVMVEMEPDKFVKLQDVITEVNTLRQSHTELRKEFDALKALVECAPGGPIFQESLNKFLKLENNDETSKSENSLSTT